ncbi:hypothetical protein [Larsenimonas suaedae]|uniref:DUF4148 domain-containing protein n=1 Tax=Larsenimonas suaedae TaxID=1851019 RepID=A0ABU1GT18_9GAMM|nr:hypothetical protein [Larsenimonas suaedae]MCM2972234.1 hypothetical protein [Larsenimonas suaedae]MDR5894970.1 hypothetical protein [Larsenimonas suaedae]
MIFRYVKTGSLVMAGLAGLLLSLSSPAYDQSDNGADRFDTNKAQARRELQEQRRTVDRQARELQRDQRRSARNPMHHDVIDRDNRQRDRIQLERSRDTLRDRQNEAR